MIVPMRKYSFLVFHADYMDFMNRIQSLGVVHIIEKKKGDLTEESQELMNKLSLYKSFVRSLTLKAGKEAAPAQGKHSFEKTYAHYSTLSAEKDKSTTLLQQYSREILAFEPWGDFDFTYISKLRKSNFKISFYTSSAAEYKSEWEDLYGAIEINRIGSTVYFICVTPKDLPLDIEAEHILLPTHPKKKIIELKDELTKHIDQLENEISSLSKACLNDIIHEQNEVARDLEFSLALEQTQSASEGKVMFLEGWVPVEKEAPLTEYLEQQNLFYETINPEESEEVPPVLLKNNSFAKLFEPITKIFSLPAYNELDLTPFLAPFFMLFFGFCTGDAGYGILILLVATVLKPKMQENFKPILGLAQWLGAAAVLFGTLSGTLFGVELAKVEVFAKFKTYFLDMNKLMVLSIILGAIQVLFGMVLNIANIVRQKGFKYALSKIGWIMIILGGAAFLGLPKLGVTLPMFATYILYGIMAIGAAFAYFYNSPDKNIFINFGAGLWDTYNMATGVVGDLLSYIRLFALGLTGGILGGVFNKLAIDLSPDIPVFGILVTITILLVGHSITLVLTILGACIHPMRLTFVEFYKNAGFEGGGKAYKPLKK